MFILLHVDVQSQCCWVKRVFFPLLNFLGTLTKKATDHKYKGFISGLSILFYRSKCLSHATTIHIFHDFFSHLSSVYLLIFFQNDWSIPSIQFLTFFKFFFKFLFFWSFCLFLGHYRDIWRFPGQGLNRSCSHWPIPEPQQHGIRASHVCNLRHSSRQHRILFFFFFFLKKSLTSSHVIIQHDFFFFNLFVF